MEYLNKKGPDFKLIPITHKCDEDRIGKVMTPIELHQFGIDLLITHLYKQNGKFIGINDSFDNEYPHLVVKNPDKELLYIWITTEMYPNIPGVEVIDNPESAINLSNRFKAKPVFAGIRLACVSTEKKEIAICGGEFHVEFTGLKRVV